MKPLSTCTSEKAENAALILRKDLLSPLVRNWKTLFKPGNLKTRFRLHVNYDRRRFHQTEPQNDRCFFCVSKFLRRNVEGA